MEGYRCCFGSAEYFLACGKPQMQQKSRSNNKNAGVKPESPFVTPYKILWSDIEIHGIEYSNHYDRRGTHWYESANVEPVTMSEVHKW